MKNTPQRSYPRTLACGDAQVQVDRMVPGDADAVEAFVAGLPAHDLMFLRRDLRHPKVRAAWMKALAAGRLHSLVARSEGQVVGCTAVVVDAQSWSPHVGELRVLVSPAWRGRGLGRVLIQESFALALELSLRKLHAQMTVDQRSAIALFEELGFRAEAVLRDHVIDHEGRTHDLALLSHDIAKVQAAMRAYGLDEAVGA